MPPKSAAVAGAQAREQREAARMNRPVPTATTVGRAGGAVLTQHHERIWRAPRLLMNRSFIALGANLGQAALAVQQAMQDIAALPHTALVSRSSLYRTEPVDSSGPDYINAVVEIKTDLSAADLLTALQGIEAGAGRSRPYRNAPRTLDLDILLYVDQVINTPELTVPHPRMLQRAFVLVPLAEIYPQGVALQQLAAVKEQAIHRL